MGLLVLLGYAIGLVLAIFILVDAYKQGGALHMVLCLLIPFYSIYWLLFRMQNRGQAIAAWIVAALLIASPAIQTRYVLGGGGGSCLLTAEQVGAELEGPYKAGETYQYRDATGCRYRKSGDTAQSLLVVPLPCSEGRLADMATGSNDFTVHEMGDEAVYAQGWLVARKGTTCYTMGVEGMSSSLTLDGRKNLMRTLLAAVK